jgi:hypothetical protein
MQINGHAASILLVDGQLAMTIVSDGLGCPSGDMTSPDELTCQA